MQLKIQKKVSNGAPGEGAPLLSLCLWRTPRRCAIGNLPPSVCMCVLSISPAVRPSPISPLASRHRRRSPSTHRRPRSRAPPLPPRPLPPATRLRRLWISPSRRHRASSPPRRYSSSSPRCSHPSLSSAGAHGRAGAAPALILRPSPPLPESFIINLIFRYGANKGGVALPCERRS